MSYSSGRARVQRVSVPKHQSPLRISPTDTSHISAGGKCRTQRLGAIFTRLLKLSETWVAQLLGQSWRGSRSNQARRRPFKRSSLGERSRSPSSGLISLAVGRGPSSSAGWPRPCTQQQPSGFARRRRRIRISSSHRSKRPSVGPKRASYRRISQS